MKSLSSVAVPLGLMISVLMPLEAHSADFKFRFTGPGVSGLLDLTYGAATDSKYPNAYEVTGISGTFTDTNNGLNIVNATVGSLVPITHDTPEETNLLAPHDFSRFAIAVGSDHGSLSFDNLFWPGGSPQTATDYPAMGGFLDIYGLLFSIGNGQVVNVWSNGTFGPPGSPIDYGVSVATAAASLDYVAGGVTVTAIPEPGTYALMLVGLGALGLVARRRQSSTA